jgi:hypothetical protein
MTTARDKPAGTLLVGSIRLVVDPVVVQFPLLVPEAEHCHSGGKFDRAQIATPAVSFWLTTVWFTPLSIER